MKAASIALALQGGGSHGAFTWGVLDRLLEDGRFNADAISGASAGAMNAVVMAHGMTIGGRDGARQALHDFWEGVAATARFGARPVNVSPAALEGTAHSGATAGMESLMSIMRHFSPRQFNPFDVNPLRDLLEAQVDFERLRRECPVELYVATTQVKSGMLRLFQTREVTLDVLLASACLPGMHHAIEIDGDAYWDGGLSANPPLFPLAKHASGRDIVMVLLQPALRTETPATVDEIRQRMSELSFSSAFFAELQGLALARSEAGASPFSFGRTQSGLRHLRTHRVDSPDFMGRLSAMSKLNVHPEFIHAMRDEGRNRAGQWLEADFPSVGERSTFDLEAFIRTRGAPAVDEDSIGAPPRSQAAEVARLRAG